MKIKSLKNSVGLSGKTVLLRTDFNVPIAHGRILEDYKISAGSESIDFLSAQGAKVVVASHLGDPRGRRVQDLSLRPVAARLRKILKKKVKFIPRIGGPKVFEVINSMKAGEIVLLENLRYFAGEYDDSLEFVTELAKGGDIYVNDAFAVSHRAQASVSAIKKILPAYAGLLLEKELIALNKVLHPQRPLLVILGGAKISTKAPLIKKLHLNSAKILIGGALANSFLHQAGQVVGRSMFDAGSESVIKNLMKNKNIASKLVLPVDYVVKRRSGAVCAVRPDKVLAGDRILDIGPESIQAFSRHIKKAKTIFWNGPMGKFEEKSFSHGTLVIANLVSARSSGMAYGVVGGGETVAALRLVDGMEFIDWISTGGGASLAYISGENLPGLRGIVNI